MHRSAAWAGRRRGAFHHGTLAGLLVLLLAACPSDPADAPAPEQMPPETSSSSGTSSPTTTGAPTADTCSNSADCPEETPFCAAPYDPGTHTAGAGVCVASCIEPEDLVRFCFDDAACCEGSSCNEVDGFCRTPLQGSSSGTDTEGSGSSSGSGSSGSGSSSGGSSSSSGGSSSSSSSGEPPPQP